MCVLTYVSVSSCLAGLVFGKTPCYLVEKTLFGRSMVGISFRLVRTSVDAHSWFVHNPVMYTIVVGTLSPANTRLCTVRMQF